MKKQASPAPTPRAATLSQSASRFSAGAASAWQNIASKSPRLAAASRREPGAARTAAPLAPPNAPRASRVVPGPQRVLYPAAPAAEPETTRQVGWREVDRAVGMSTERKYSLFGIKFGPKIPVFETEKVKLPVYQETDQEKRYYAVVEAKEVDRVKRVKQEGFVVESNNKNVVPQTIEQFNTNKHICFFSNEASAHIYGQRSIGSEYAVIAFIMPEYQNFNLTRLNDMDILLTTQSIPVECIKSAREYRLNR